MATSHPYLRRATTSVLVAVALISGAILLLGDRFDPVGGDALTQPAHVEARIAACVADESMRLINPDRERCRPEERELVQGHDPMSPAGFSPTARLTSAGPAGRPGADGVSGYEIVTAKVAMAAHESAVGEAHCSAGKVALGGGVLPDAESPGKPGGTEYRLDVVFSGPLLPSSGGGASGWTATVRNTSAAALSVVVAAVCATAR